MRNPDGEKVTISKVWDYLSGTLTIYYSSLVCMHYSIVSYGRKARIFFIYKVWYLTWNLKSEFLQDDGHFESIYIGDHHISFQVESS